MCKARWGRSVLTGMLTVSTMFAMGSAHAAASSFANLTLSLELIDLNIADGIAPGIIFAGDGNVSSQVTGYAYQSPSGLFGDSFIENGDTSAALSGSANALPYAAASASMGALVLNTNGSFSGLNFTTATEAFEQPGANLGGYAQASTYFQLNSFELTPNTLAVFRGTASAAAGFDGVNSTENAQAYVFLQASGSAGGGGSQNESDTASLFVQTGGPSSQTFSGPLAVSFSNLTNAPMIGSFYASTQVYAQSVTSAVPEPSAALLGLAGIGLLGAAARARARKRSDTSTVA